MSSVSNNGSGYVNYLATVSSSSNSSVLASAASKKAKYDKGPFILAAFSNRMLLELIDIISSYANEILGGLYGHEAWKNWRNVDVLDIVPVAPLDHLSNRILLYIPRRIRFNDQEIDMNLKALTAICSDSFSHLNPEIVQQFRDNFTSGWVLLEKAVIPESLGKDSTTQERMVAAKGRSLPRVGEAILLNLMVNHFTGERLFGDKPCTYTRCTERVDGQYPIVVGGFGSFGLIVGSSHFDCGNYGASCALR